MLIEFSVENFRSIKDRVTLSMIAANLRARDPHLDAETVIEVNEKLSLLSSAVIYGANASGKSNVIRAFSFMRRFIKDSAREVQADDPIPVEPFRLNPGTNSMPSTFEAVFTLGGLQHRYGFSANSDRVVREWLYYTPTVREAELFTRDEAGIHVSERFREGRVLQGITRDNALFLSVVAQFNGETASRIRRWFTQDCGVLTAADDYGYLPYTIECIQEGKHREQIESLVRRLDLDIRRLSVAEVPLRRPPVEIMARLDEADSDSDNAPIMSNAATSRQDMRKELRATHAIRNGEGRVVGEAEFPVAWMESQGTQKLIALAGPIIDTLTHGHVLMVDEIDARLHPIITAALLGLFNSVETNPHHAQLVCATHDTHLLDRQRLRRDQIYFVEKDRNAATKLFSLADFKLELPTGAGRTVRNDASFERNYIQGRYGAIPYVGDLAQLFAEELQGGERPLSNQGELRNAVAR